MEKKILMAITTYKQVPAICFKHHFTNLIDAAKNCYIKRIMVEHDMYVTAARNKIAGTALMHWQRKEITHLLYVDDDVLIPAGGIKLLADADVPVIGALYFTREFLPSAYSFTPKFHQLDEVPETGIFDVDVTGAGALLIECSVLQKMKDKYKSAWWFQNTIEAEPDGEERYLGEDVFFFKRLKEMGIRAAINCDVKCDHVSSSVTNFETYKMKKQHDAMMCADLNVDLTAS